MSQKGFQALGVDVWDGDASGVKRYFVDPTGTTYPVLLKGSRVGSQYGVDRDVYMVVDQDGIVRYLSPGGLGQRYNEMAVTSAIRSLLASDSDAAQSASDFDGNGEVGFDDFFLFAAAFGGRDEKFDLNRSGAVDFDDFFLFAADFGKKARG